MQPLLRNLNIKNSVVKNVAHRKLANLPTFPFKVRLLSLLPAEYKYFSLTARLSLFVLHLSPERYFAQKWNNNIQDNQGSSS